MSSLVVDWTRCDGHGLCARLLPEAVALDEWGFPIIDPTIVPPPGAVRLAISTCPRLALRIEE